VTGSPSPCQPDPAALNVLKGTKAQESRRQPACGDRSNQRRPLAESWQTPVGKCPEGRPKPKRGSCGNLETGPHGRLAGRPPGRAQVTAKRDRVSDTPDTVQAGNSRRRTKPMRERRRPVTAQSRATGVKALESPTGNSWRLRAVSPGTVLRSRQAPAGPKPFQRASRVQW
jgi:hypothetical protein